jgi:hypothetical protein
MSLVWIADKPLKTREQIARVVHAVSLARRLDELATVIGLIMSTEVGHNDSNSQRQWWCPWNPAYPQTQNFQFDSESDDGFSSGYQQQVSSPDVWGKAWGWGGLFGNHEGARKRMTSADSANVFLEARSDNYTAEASNPALAADFAQRVHERAHDRIECAWPTVAADGSYDQHERWPDPQIISMRDLGGALTPKLRAGVDHHIGHKQYTGLVRARAAA